MSVFATLVARRPTIAPGQSLQLVWAVCDPDRIAESANFTLLVNGRSVPLDADGHHRAEVAALPGHGALEITSAQLGDGLSEVELDALYRTGSTIDVQLMGFYNRRDHAPGLNLYTSTPAHIRVAAEPSVGLSFTDDSSAPITRALWKEPYNLVVALSNYETRDITCQINATEREPDTGASRPLEPHRVTLSRNSTQRVPVRVPPQDWTWITAEQVTGPMSKRFVYDVEVTGTDGFGNPIDRRPGAIGIEVAVSDEKQAWGATAMTNFWWGLVDEVLAFIIPEAEYLHITSTVHHGGAAIAEALAEDPPSPDKEYAKPDHLVLPNELPKSSHMPHYTTLTRMAWEIPYRRDHLFVIESKVLGAYEAQDEAAEKKLVGQYLDELTALGRCYRTMVDAMEPALEELAKHGVACCKLPARVDQLLAHLQLGEMPNLKTKRWEKPAEHTAEIARFARGLQRLDPDDLDVRRLLRQVMIATGRAIQGTIRQSMLHYARIRPDYFPAPHKVLKLTTLTHR